MSSNTAYTWLLSRLSRDPTSIVLDFLAPTAEQNKPEFSNEVIRRIAPDRFTFHVQRPDVPLMLAARLQRAVDSHGPQDRFSFSRTMCGIAKLVYTSAIPDFRLLAFTKRRYGKTWAIPSIVEAVQSVSVRPVKIDVIVIGHRAASNLFEAWRGDMCHCRQKIGEFSFTTQSGADVLITTGQSQIRVRSDGTLTGQTQIRVRPDVTLTIVDEAHIWSAELCVYLRTLKNRVLCIGSFSDEQGPWRLNPHASCRLGFIRVTPNVETV
jgi:hypothetical protein